MQANPSLEATSAGWAPPSVIHIVFGIEPAPAPRLKR
jgi:hypothetical protein